MAARRSASEGHRFALRARLERLLLWHFWACAPFGLAWAVWPYALGPSTSPEEIGPMRTLYAVVGATLVLRTFLAKRGLVGAWHGYVWPVVDAGFITAAALITKPGPASWVVALYVLPVLEAAATLNLAWTLAVALLSAAACGVADGLGNLAYAYFAFRLFLLVVVGSLFSRLARSLATAQERLAVAQYRNELAAEMHDGLQQYLGAIAMRLEVARSTAERDPAEAARIAIAQQDVARRATDELRYMVRRLRSPNAGESFLETVRQQVDLAQERCDAVIRLQSEGVPRTLAPKAEHGAVRILQEALNNCAKHSEASNIEVRISFGPEALEVSIEDDGRGFDPRAAHADEGIGLETMAQRAEAVGGAMSVGSREAGGTRVAFRIPYAPDSATRAPMAESVEEPS